MGCYNFLYTTDRTYFPHMLTSIYSLITNHLEEDIVIHIVQSDFTKDEYLKLEVLQEIYRNVDIKVYSMERISNLIQQFDIPKWRNTDIANARLFASEFVQGIDKLLYIDSDTIVGNSLIDLFHQKVDNPLSAVKEIEVPLRMKTSLKQYYNSGVLLFNYDKWEQYDCLQMLYDKIKTTDVPLIFPDQDLINLALSEIISPLSIDYNITPQIYSIMEHRMLAKKKFKNNPHFYSYEEILSALQQPHIFHLLGLLHGRPWQKDTINPFNSFYEQYRNMWDPNFEKEDNPHIMTRLKISSYLNVLASTCLPTEVCQNMKSYVRKITGRQ